MKSFVMDQSNAMRRVEIRKAIQADIEVLIPAVARAFAPQPITQWLVGNGSDALRRGERLIQLEFEKALPYELTYTTSDLRGAALWHPPNKKLHPWHDLVWAANSAAAVRVSRNIFSLMLMGLRLAVHEPHARHYYLAVLAVDPVAQGQGTGARLLEPGLATCDQQGIPAYLVTDTEGAVRFYQRHGFRIRHQFRIYQTNLTIWTMWREPVK